MDLERARAFLLSLPHVAEAEQFGGLIYWLGDKAIGGRMFAHLSLDEAALRISFPAGVERFHELLEREGLVPAPYLARAHWVAAERWDVFRHTEWEDGLRRAHTLTLERMAPKTRKLLALPQTELQKAVAERKRLLAARAAAK